MTFLKNHHQPPPIWPRIAWGTAGVTGIALPLLALVLLANGAAPGVLASLGGTIFAVGLMGVGMIAAAVAGSFSLGIGLALASVLGLIVLALVLGMPIPLHLASLGFAMLIASLSFAARGALFARSAMDKGWWIALFVVAGEVAIVATALALPGALPDWLLALLPAQWASVAIQTAMTGTGTRAASSALIALAATAGATLFVAAMWPRRWPYAVMFTTWLAASALVFHQPAPPLPPAAQLASSGARAR